jgi:heme-degrading monooxygenase HmoA
LYAVIFEVEPTAEGKEGYLALAADLRAELETIDGFISVERFQSLTTEGKLLSLSYWRDEAAIKDWRERQNHRAAQQKGRDWLFRTYRIKVASVLRDYGMGDEAERPE